MIGCGAGVRGAGDANVRVVEARRRSGESDRSQER